MQIKLSNSFTKINPNYKSMNVIITGAGKGIGKALALQFSREERLRMFLISRSAQNLEEVVNECRSINAAAEISGIPYDLDRLLVDELPEELRCSHVDILINNAGMLINKEFQAITPGEMMKMVSTNFLAPTCLIQKMLDAMGGKNPTHVVNIGSMAGFQGSRKFPGLSVYSACKAAIASITECMAEEFTGKNIYFNCLAIGSVQTEMLAAAFPGLRAPLKPEQIAEFIVHFALNGYKYMNGRVIPVSLVTP
jgi:short-subunit dehydrogenase